MDPVNILVVDDDARVRTLIIHLLRDDLPTARFAEAGTVAAALAIAVQADWHVILLDIRLPDGNGLAVFPELAALAPGAAIIVMTAQSGLPYAEVVEKLGGSAFLPKADLPARLLSAVRFALARRR